MAADEALAGKVGEAMVKPGADAAPEATPALLSGIGVVTEGAVLAGVIERAGMLLLLLLLLSSFLPQAPNAKITEKAMTVAAVRMLTNFMCMWKS